MKNRKFAVSIIIINYNSSEYTINCVKSVLENTCDSLIFEIIVVDNASEKKDYELLVSLLNSLKSERVSVHKSRINTGFGGGNMFGVQHSRSDYYLFLNNDTILNGEAISICHSFMEQNPNVAVCGPQILNEAGKKEVSFDHFTSFWREVFGKKAIEVLFSKPDRRKSYAVPIPVDYVNGSFMLFRASDFNKVGGFDTNIFLYFEESDICYRLKQLGKLTYFIPSASYVHYHGKSIDKTGIQMTTKIELKTSMFYVIRKNYGYFHYQILRTVFIFRYALTSMVKPKYISLLIRILTGLPLGKSLKQRQVIID